MLEKLIFYNLMHIFIIYTIVFCVTCLQSMTPTNKLALWRQVLFFMHLQISSELDSSWHFKDEITMKLRSAMTPTPQQDEFFVSRINDGRIVLEGNTGKLKMVG